MIFYLIPVLNALILGSIVLFATHWYLRRDRLVKLVANVVSSLEEQLIHRLDAANFNMEVDALLDARLDDLVFVFKQQIPMASLLLTGSLAQKLKVQAKGEIMKILPGLKQKVLEHLTTKVDLREAVLHKVREMALEKRAKQLAAAAAGVGFLLGLINVALMRYF